MSEQEQFGQMMLALQSSDNVLRKAAEAQYMETKSSNGNWLFQALLETAASSENSAMQQICLVELRKILLHPDFTLAAFTGDDIERIKQRTMEMMANSQNKVVRGLASECCAHMAGKLYQSYPNPNGNGSIRGPGWNDLWPLLLKTMVDQNSSKELRCACSHVFAALGEDAVEFALDGQHRHIAGAFCQAFSLNPEDMDANVQFISDLGDLLNYVDRQSENFYAKPVSSVLEIFAVCLNNQMWEQAREIGSILCGCLGDCPKLFKSNATGVLDGMYQVACSINDVPKECRFAAVEVLLTYCEADASVVRKHNYTQKIFDLLIEYCKHPVYEDDWATTEEPNDDDMDEAIEKATDFDIGCTGIDRWAHALRAKHVRNIAAGAVVQLIKSGQWQDRLAAVTAITYITEACAEEFGNQIGQIMGYVYPLLNDDSQYVRFAASLAIAQACSDFAPKLQKEQHATLLPALCQSLKDVPRTATMAAGAIGSFFELARDVELEKDEKQEEMFAGFAQHYMTPILDNLLPLVESTQYFFLRRELLDALGLICEAMDTHMTPFVERLVPVFQQILAFDDNALGHTHDEMDKLRCLSLQAVTLLAAGVKYDGFQKYAKDVCDFLVNLMRQNLPYDDPRAEYVLRGWTCMSECLAKVPDQLRPYMDVVVPRLLEIAGRDCDYEYVEDKPGELMNDENDNNNNGGNNLPAGVEEAQIAHPERGVVNVRFKTAEATEKCLAIEVCYEMAKELQQSNLFVPFLDRMAEVGMSALTFKTLKEVRLAGANFVRITFQLYKRFQENNVAGIVNHLFPRLIALVQNEPVVSVVQFLLELLRDVVGGGPDNCVDPKEVELGAKVMTAIMAAAIKRKNEIAQERQGIEDEDDTKHDELDEEDDQEDLLISATAECMGACVKKIPAYVPHFENDVMENLVRALLIPTTSAPEQRAGLSLVNYYVESGADGVQKVLDNAISSFLQYADHEHPDLAQVAIYGLGTVLKYVSKLNGYNNTELGQAIYGKLFKFWEKHPSSGYTEEDEEYAYEDTKTNYLSTALCVIELAPQACNMEQIWSQIGAYLPCKEDEEEACIVHEKLLRWAKGENRDVASNAQLVQGIVSKLRQAKDSYLNQDTKDELNKM